MAEKCLPFFCNFDFVCQSASRENPREHARGPAWSSCLHYRAATVISSGEWLTVPRPRHLNAVLALVRPLELDSRQPRLPGLPDLSVPPREAPM